VLSLLEDVQRGAADALVNFVQKVSARVFEEIPGEPASFLSYTDEDAVQSVLPFFEGAVVGCLGVCSFSDVFLRVTVRVEF
jgi:hypothetical protein